MAPPTRPNLTGFDVRKLAASSGSPANDPWKRYEAWRSTGPFSRFNRFRLRQTFPGLGIATVAFATFCAVEALFFKDDHHGGHEEHGKEHH